MTADLFIPLVGRIGELAGAEDWVMTSICGTSPGFDCATAANGVQTMRAGRRRNPRRMGGYLDNLGGRITPDRARSTAPEHRAGPVVAAGASLGRRRARRPNRLK